MLGQCGAMTADIKPTLNKREVLVRVAELSINSYNAEIFVYKPWRLKGFLNFKSSLKCYKTSDITYSAHLNTFVLVQWPLEFF